MENTTIHSNRHGTQFREELDEDGDGTVSLKEKSNYITRLRERWSDDPPAVEISLDGNQLSEIELDEIRTENVGREVRQRQPALGEVTVNGTFTGALHADSHEIEVAEFAECRGGGEYTAATVTVDVMPNHEFDQVSHPPDDRTEHYVAVGCPENPEQDLRVTYAAVEAPADESQSKHADTGGNESGQTGSQEDQAAGDQTTDSTPFGGLVAVVLAGAAAVALTRRRS